MRKSTSSSYTEKYNVNTALEYALLSAIVIVLLGGAVFVVVGVSSYIEMPLWRTVP